MPLPSRRLRFGERWSSAKEPQVPHVAGRRGRTLRSLADPWDRVASRSGHPGPPRRRPIAPAAGARAGVVRPPRPARRGHPRGGVLGSTRPAPVRRHAVPPPRGQRRARDLDNEGIIPVLARAVREVEAGAQRGPVRPSGARSSRSSPCWCARSAPGSRPTPTSSDAQRAEQLKRLDGIATILAKTAARDTSLLALLAEDAVVSDAARSLKREMLLAAGFEPAPEEAPRTRARGELCRAGAPGRPPVGHLPAARQPLPRPGLLGRPGPPARRRAAWPAGSCSARCSGRSSRAAERPPAWTCPSRPPCARRTAWSSCTTRRRSSRQRRPATARSCSPTSRAWARPRRRCSPRRPRTPSRCWWSSRTSSRRTGRARPSCGHPGTRPP